MRTYSSATAVLLHALQEGVHRYADQPYPTADVVHHDLNPRNVLVTADGITGVVDWEGWCYGDRMFDVATMLFYSYTDVRVRHPLWQAICARVGPAVGGVYLRHLIHRQVDWSIRHHGTETVAHWLRIAGQVLSALAV